MYRTAAAGRYLVVAVNDDKSTRALIGDGHPVLPVRDRASLLSSLEMVDAVLVFSSQSVTRIADKLRAGADAKSVELVPGEGM